MILYFLYEGSDDPVQHTVVSYSCNTGLLEKGWVCIVKVVNYPVYHILVSYSSNTVIWGKEGGGS